MAFPSFNQAHKRGISAEDEILEIVQKQYPNAHRIRGYFKGYDIYVPETDDKIEVKRDLQAIKTGNYFIETMYGDKLSGINTTKSTYYVIVDNELIVWIRTDTLKYLIREGKEITFQAKNKEKSRTGKLIKRDKIIHNPYVTCYKRR